MAETNEADDKRVKRRRFILSALAVIGSVILSIVMKTPVIIPLPNSPPPHELGWIDDPKSVNDLIQSLPQPLFAQTPAATDMEDGPEDVFLWEGQREVLGDLIPPRNQSSVGSCVGFGATACVEILHADAIWRAKREGKPAPEFKPLAQEITYAGARVEANGGSARFSGDGAVGADAVKFLRGWGVLPRGKYDRIDLSQYDVNITRRLGNMGVPDELEPICKQSPVRSFSQVRSWEDARKAIKSRYPVMLCGRSSFGNVRDADGFCRYAGPFPGGGGHCTALIGVQGGNRPGGFVLNSWSGEYYRGPMGKGDGSPGGCWHDAKDIDTLCRSGDCWAFSDAVGFPSRKTNWFANPQPK